GGCGGGQGRGGLAGRAAGRDPRCGRAAGAARARPWRGTAGERALAWLPSPGRPTPPPGNAEPGGTAAHVPVPSAESEPWLALLTGLLLAQHRWAAGQRTTAEPGGPAAPAHGAAVEGRARPGSRQVPPGHDRPIAPPGRA